MDTSVEMLEQRIAELEKQLQSLSSQRQQPQINAEEMATFKKVGKQLGYDVIDECGINECQPVIRFCYGPSSPHYHVPIKFCYECSCGPCNYFDYRNLGNFGLERFRTMGY